MPYGVEMTVPELEQYVHQLEQTFQPTIIPTDDYHKFKIIGESFLKKAMEVKPHLLDTRMELLEYIFNRKLFRILFAVGCEFIVKSAYLKMGYVINRLIGTGWRPVLRNDLSDSQIDSKHVVNFSHLINHMNVLFSNLTEKEVNGFIKKGLGIVRVWRNKDVHWSTFHRESGDQIDEIENSLLNIYSTIFNDLQTIKNILGVT